MYLKKAGILIVCSFVYLLFPLVLCAQNNTYTVVGVVCEPNSTTTIPYVTIQSYVAGTTSNPVYACVSDGMGKFNITIANPGEYDIVFSCVGKRTHIAHVSLKTETTIDLMTVRLEDQSKELGEVNVYGQKPLVSVLPDKIIYNVSDDPQAFNSNLLKIAQKIPVLNVDRENGILLNNCTPLILINGRKVKSINRDPVLFLKSTAATKILKIEIVSTPGSKYDGDETCGVVNIVTNKTNDASLMVGAEGDSNLGYNMFADVGYKQNKFTANGNLSYSSTKKFDTEKYSERLNKKDELNYKLIQSSENKLIGNDVSKAFSIDASYEIDSLNILNFSTGYNQIGSKSVGNQSNIMSDIAGVPVYAFNAKEYSGLKLGDYNIGLNYEHISKDKRNTFTVLALKEVEYVEQSNDQEALSILNYTGSHFVYDQNEKMDENTLQIDFVHNFKNESKLSTGAKTIFRDNSDVSEKYNYAVDIAVQKENFNNNQFVFSLYSEYAFKIKKRLNVSAGLRFETTSIDGGFENNNMADFSTNYLNLLPYLLLSTKTSKGILLSTSYNAKMQRPGVTALNPTIVVLDQQSIYYGNPSLTSEYLNKISFDYSNSLKRIKQFAKLSYTFSDNSIQNTSGIANNIYYTTYTNDGKFRDLNLYLNLSSRITSWMRARLSGSASYIALSNQEASNSGFTGSVNASAFFDLTKGYEISMSGMYRFPGVTLQGYGFNFYSSYLGASKAFFNDKLNVELAVSNPFWKTKKYSRTMEADDFRIATDVFNIGREFLISVSYTFNDKDIRASKTSKSIENQDLVGSKGAQ
jgi:hypothetical protein